MSHPTGDDNAGNGGQQQQTPDNQQSQQAQSQGQQGQGQPGQQGQGQQGSDQQRFDKGGSLPPGSSQHGPDQQRQQAQQGDQGNGDRGQDGNAGRPPGGEQTFSQEQVDRIVGDRLARERGKYADYDDLKAQAAELVELKKSQMSDQEKAVDAARTEGKAAAAKEFSGRLVDAEIRAATVNRLTDDQRATLLTGLDRSRFLAKDGEVDLEKVRTFVDAVAPAPTPSPPPPPVTGGTRMGQGRHPAGDKPSLLSGRERFEQQRKRANTT